MTFRMERHLDQFYKDKLPQDHGTKYPEGSRLAVQISAAFGLSTQSATLVSLGKREGITVIKKSGRSFVMKPGQRLWTDKGYAVAE